MSFCPSNDIHSIYLDNELPLEFKAEYEKHVENCPACKAKLEKLRELNSVFEMDAKAITPDSHYMAESFERLKIKMSYSKTVVPHKSEKKFNNFGYYAMAAAAVVAFAFVVPLRVKNNSVQNGTVASVPYVSAGNNVSFDSGRSVVISGNIGDTVLSSVSSGNEAYVLNMAGMKNGYGEHMHHHSHHNHDMIRDIEMIRPDFTADTTISIKITMPGMNAGPIPPDFIMPGVVITGN